MVLLTCIFNYQVKFLSSFVTFGSAEDGTVDVHI